jgi:hypothetical protein
MVVLQSNPSQLELTEISETTIEIYGNKQPIDTNTHRHL